MICCVVWCCCACCCIELLCWRCVVSAVMLRWSAKYVLLSCVVLCVRSGVLCSVVVCFLVVSCGVRRCVGAVASWATWRRLIVARDVLCCIVLYCGVL